MKFIIKSVLLRIYSILTSIKFLLHLIYQFNLPCNFDLYIFHKRNNACCLLWLRKNLIPIENLALDLEGCTGHLIYHCKSSQAHPQPSYGKDESCSRLIPTPIDFVEPSRSLQSISFYLPLLYSILK